MKFARRFVISTLATLPLLINPLLAATKVTVAPLASFLVFPSDSAPATVTSLNTAKISARISALIKSISVQPGDRVKKGATLVNLDCNDNRLLHESALARLSLAKKDAKRARSLRKSSNIAEQTYNQAINEEIQAGIHEKQMALQVRRCKVAAPFGGVVTARIAAEGELATPGTPLLTIMDTEALEISVQLPSEKVAQVSTLPDLSFTYHGKAFPVSLQRTISVINPASGNQELRLTFTGDKALPGSSGRLTWKLTTPHIPSELLSQRDNKVGIFLARDGKAVFHPLDNAQIGHPAPSDLPPATHVILEGRYGLHNGDPIEVSP